MNPTTNKNLREKLFEFPDDMDVYYEDDGVLMPVTYVEIFPLSLSRRKIILLSNENPYLGSGGIKS